MQKTGRNDFCPCGSGKKYKKCCEIKTRSKKLNASVLASTENAFAGMTRVSSLFFRSQAKNIESAEVSVSAAQES